MTVPQEIFEASPSYPPETNENTRIVQELTPNEQETLNSLRDHIHDDATLTAKQKAFCTDACLLRYLRARDFHLKHAEDLLRSTLKWRDEYKPDEISPYDAVMDHEAETGKIFIAGKDLHGRPVLYMRPNFQNTKNYEDQNKLTVYMLERCVQAMDTANGIENLALIIDYNGYSLRNAPPMSQSKEIMQILSDHYPERLGIAMLMDAPFIFHGTYKLLQPFIPHKTKEKVHFVHGHKAKHMQKYFDLDSLPIEYGGNKHYIYDHQSYWANEKAVWDARHQ